MDEKRAASDYKGLGRLLYIVRWSQHLLAIIAEVLILLSFAMSGMDVSLGGVLAEVPLIKILWAGMFALGVYHGARFSEVIRSGIQSIPKTQLEAALSTGLTVTQAYRFVIIPIALRLLIPPITNESLNLLKNSSVALTIGVAELTFQTRQIETYTAKAFEALTAGTLIYLVLCLGLSAFMAVLEKRCAIPGLIARVTPAEH